MQPVLGLAPRQFKAALSGAGVAKGGNGRERTAKKEKEKEEEKEGEPSKDGPLSSNREAGGRGKEKDAQARGGPAAASQPGGLFAPTIL